jgi:Uma2 family endonuclease
MGSYPKEKYYAEDEYLALEREAEYRSEYFAGRVYAMAGGSREHSAITVNVTVVIGSQLRGKPCQAFSNDMKVRAGRLYAYPDLSVVCGEPTFRDARRDVLLNPVVLFEVLSPSTEAFDRGKKLAQYQQIPSLKDYVMIAQDEPRIDHYERRSDNEWRVSIIVGMGANVHLDSIDCTLPLSEVYDKVEFALGSEKIGE